MKEQIAIQTLIQKNFLKLKSKNSAYSIRAFSNKLGMDSGAVSQIMNGKRKVSMKLAQKICDALMLDPQERNNILKLFGGSNKTSYSNEQINYMQLSSDQFQVIANWLHFAILSLIKTKKFQNNTEWIADRFGINKKEVEQALSRLRRLKLIEETKTGEVIRLNSAIRTTDDIADLSLRRAHSESLELAKASLEKTPVHLRDYTTVTFPTNIKKIKKAKELIRNFQDELCSLMEDTDNPEEVYRLSIELFPLTRLLQ